jgi:hypothetical protein
MRKINLLLLTFFASTTLSAGVTTKRTHLITRPQIDDLVLETTGRHDSKNFKDKYGFNYHFQSTFFTNHSIKGEDVGKYFAIDGTNQVVVKGAATAAAVIADPTIDIWDRFIIHDQAAEDATDVHADFSLNPKQEVFGARFDLFGSLENAIPNTFFKISAPVVYIENDLHTNYNTNIDNAGDGTGQYVSEFFEGSAINVGDASNLQDKLAYAKIDGSRHIAFGLADVDAHLGYKLVDQKTRHVYLSGLITIPTGNRPKGEFMFEPIYGNGNHFAVGCQLDVAARLWNYKRHSGCVQFNLKHKYTFEGSEKRTIPLNLQSYPWAHYYLAGKVGQADGTALFPLANVLTQDVTVRPGNSLEGQIDFKFKTKRFMLDFGYNLYYKEKENMHLKTAWQDNLYGIADIDVDTDNYAEAGGFSIAEDAFLAVNNSILDLNGALTPNWLNHKIFAGIGYNFSINGHPSYLGVGGSYQFADNNFELEGYQFWIKGNCAF